MSLHSLRDRIIDTGLIEPTGLVADIVAGFDALKDTTEHVELLRDIAEKLVEVNFHGKQSEALAVLLNLPPKQVEDLI